MSDDQFILECKLTTRTVMIDGKTYIETQMQMGDYKGRVTRYGPIPDKVILVTADEIQKSEIASLQSVFGDRLNKHDSVG